MMYWVSMKVDDAFIGAAIVNRPTQEEAVKAAGQLAEPHLCDRHGPEIEMAIGPIPHGAPVPAEAVERFLTYEQMEAFWSDLKSLETHPDGSITLAKD